MTHNARTQADFNKKVRDLLGQIVDLAKLSRLDINKPILIYGAGNVGSSINRILCDSEYKVEGFLDRNAKNGSFLYGKPIYSTNNYITIDKKISNKTVIISFIGSKEQHEDVKKQLQKEGFSSILTYFDVYRLLITNQITSATNLFFQTSKTQSTPFWSIKDRILETSSFFTDKESQDVFINSLKAILFSDTALYSAPDKGEQYFVDNICFNKGYSRFIDCGAYDGDTASSLKRIKGEITAIACYEPDSHNFAKLTETLCVERVADDQIFFPCGVWSRTEMLGFQAGASSTSSITDTGNTYLQCVTIDESIPDFAPTFIKMDVEGAEYEALLGAKKTIQMFKPDLAISIYHQIDHFWEILLLINSLTPDYHYYLRSHGDQGIETVLYAVSG